MPELPEVETVRAGLAEHILGASIEAVEVHDVRSIRRHRAGAADFVDGLTGVQIDDVARRGKYLWLLLGREGERETRAAVVHLGMSGQLRLKTADLPREKHLKITLSLRLADGRQTELRFVDQRIFGGIFLDPLTDVRDEAGDPAAGASRSVRGEAVVPSSVCHIARDPIDPLFSERDFRARLRRTSTGIKRLLLDQSVISGVGNIYADEALWLTKLHYAKLADRLTASQTRELINALRTVMDSALAAGGTSFDALYVNVNGESGYFDRSLNAYGQAGRACPRCLDNGRISIIVRDKFMNRSSFRCPHCQRVPHGLTQNPR